MNVLNAAVTHVTFGKGIIVNQTKTNIDVRFSTKQISMQYPMAFDKFLTLTDSLLREKVASEIQEIKDSKQKATFARRASILQEIESKRKQPVNKISEYPQIFDHTMNFCEDNDRLRLTFRERVKDQLIIPEAKELDITEPDESDSQHPEIIISNKRSMQAASDYKDKKVCVLNMASAVKAGDNPRKSSSQEASLCRISTLYKSLASVSCWNHFYRPHRENSSFLNNDDIIYTPGVIVFKTDTEFPELMPEEDWYSVDIITCAAPKLQKKAKGNLFLYEDHPEGISGKNLLEILKKRIEKIFKVAHSQGAEILILGAWDVKAIIMINVW